MARTELHGGVFRPAHVECGRAFAFHGGMMRDYSTATGAQRLADDIAAYWAERGHSVKIWVEFYSGRRGDMFHIRSDMVNGLPLMATYKAAA